MKTIVITLNVNAPDIHDYALEHTCKSSVQERLEQCGIPVLNASVHVMPYRPASPTVIRNNGRLIAAATEKPLPALEEVPVPSASNA